MTPIRILEDVGIGFGVCALGFTDEGFLKLSHKHPYTLGQYIRTLCKGSAEMQALDAADGLQQIL